MCGILIAEDEYLEREIIKSVASRVDGAHIVGEGNCGRLAVELCLAVKPDLAFINCHMGGLDGFEAVRKIRKFDHNVSIVMTTGYDTNLARRDLSGLVIADYLLKPIPPSRLEEIIRRHLRKDAAPTNPAIPARRKKSLRFYPNQIMSKEITRALIYIGNNYRNDISLESVSGVVSLSSYYFSRLFKREVGVNFSDFLKHKRLDAAKRLLTETENSILDISTSVGYLGQSYFCKIFKKHVGTTPSEYRKNRNHASNERRQLKERYL